MSKLFIHEPLMKVFSYERVIYVLFCNSCIFCILHLFLTNILLESWNFLTIFFIEPCMIRADDLVLSTYKCTYNGSMRWPSTNKMNSVFSNDSSSSLFLFQCCSDKWELQKVKTSQFEDQRVSLCRLSAVSTKDVRSLNNFSFPPTYEFPWV